MSAVKDWKVWVFMLCYIGVAEPFYALALFTPTIVASLGTFTLPQSQLLSTPPYFLAFGTTMLTAVWSDRIGRRGAFMIFWMSWTILGYIIVISVDPTQNPAAAYVGIFFAISGVAPCISTCITWCGNNLGPTYKRATGMGMMFTLGNSGGIVASEVYRSGDSPRYIRGHAVSLGFAGMALITSLILWFAMDRENKRRDREFPAVQITNDPNQQREQQRDVKVEKSQSKDDDYDEVDADPDYAYLRERNTQQLKAWGLDGLSEQEVVDLGDGHPAFRYIL